MKHEAFIEAMFVQQHIDELTEFLGRHPSETLLRIGYGFGGQIKVAAGPIREIIESELAKLRAELAALGIEVAE